jgi:hypothetical protein
MTTADVVISNTIRRKKTPRISAWGSSLITSLTITDERARDAGNAGTFTEFVTPAQAGAYSICAFTKVPANHETKKNPAHLCTGFLSYN